MKFWDNKAAFQGEVPLPFEVTDPILAAVDR